MTGKNGCRSGKNQANTRSSVLKLKHPLRNTCSGQKKIMEQLTDGAEVVENLFQLIESVFF